MIRPERCELASNFCIARVLTGLWQVADMEREDRVFDRSAALSAMAEYVSAGFDTFDMADHYGSAEELVGEFLQQHKPSTPIRILTKWVPAPGPVTREAAREAVQRSLTRLRSERIDLLQFHAWNFSDPSYLDALGYLEEFRQEGLIRHLGLTNFDTGHLAVVVKSGIEIVSNQVSFSLLDQRARRRMLPFCRANGIQLLSYGTLAGGLLTERFLGSPEPAQDQLETWSHMKYKRFIDAAGGWTAFQILLGTLSSISKRTGLSIANLASRAILDQPGVGGVIVGARLGQTDHLQDNLLLAGRPLDAASTAEIESALLLLQPIPGDCGDEYRKPPFLTASGDLSDHLSSFPSVFSATSHANGRMTVNSGTEWEELASYSRAVRVGNRIFVSGTTATHGSRVIGGTDAGAQTHHILDKIEAAVRSLGGRLEDITRTRIFVKQLDDWELVARAHGERFHGIMPANTLVQANLIGEEYLVEIEADAVIS